MSKRLEDFINNNRQEFDDLEPGANLWGRIEAELPAQFQEEEKKKKEAKTFSLGFVLRVAAAVIVVMGACFFYYVNSQKPATISLAAINPEYAKQQVHYTSMIANQRTELKSIATTDPQLYKEFTTELAKMDSTYKKLNKDLVTSPNQEAVLRAMIRNLQMQTEVLNQQLNVIEQFNQFKDQQNNEIKNI